MTSKKTTASTAGVRESMEIQNFIQTRVKQYYWEKDLNCATTTLKILSEHFNVNLSQQVLDSALGMHGAGKYGAQCGLVEGTLLFLGIWGRLQKIPDDTIVAACHRYAQQFDGQFSSLDCRALRPEGFHPENPPHLCEGLTCDAVRFNLEFVQGVFRKPQASEQSEDMPMNNFLSNSVAGAPEELENKIENKKIN